VVVCLRMNNFITVILVRKDLYSGHKVHSFFASLMNSGFKRVRIYSSEYAGFAVFGNPGILWEYLSEWPEQPSSHCRISTRYSTNFMYFCGQSEQDLMKSLQTNTTTYSKYLLERLVFWCISQLVWQYVVLFGNSFFFSSITIKLC